MVELVKGEVINTLRESRRQQERMSRSERRRVETGETVMSESDREGGSDGEDERELDISEEDPEYQDALKQALKAEYYMELVCNEQSLNPKMTLATVRHIMWKSGGEMTLHYQKRQGVPYDRLKGLNDLEEWSKNANRWGWEGWVKGLGKLEQ
jgi:hypothetical protein